jgi:hypothetical protein
MRWRLCVETLVLRDAPSALLSMRVLLGVPGALMLRRLARINPKSCKLFGQVDARKKQAVSKHEGDKAI